MEKILVISAGLEKQNIKNMDKVAAVTYLSESYCALGCGIKDECESNRCAIRELLNSLD